MDELLPSERLRGRRELEFLPVEDSVEQRWCVFDPVSRQSFRVGFVEQWFLTHATDSQSLSELIATFRSSHAGPETDANLLSTIAQLANAGLLHREHASSNAAKTSARQASGWISKLVVFQIRGFQPERILARLAPHFGAFFSSRAVCFWLWMAAAATFAVLLDVDRLSSEIGSFNWLVRPSSGGSLFLVFILTRGFHELGHALVCTRFGIRCPDIGIFVILGAPCVYCDVSESWKLTRRWKRAAVASAGMYVELIVATLAAFLWLATSDGSLHTLAMQTMLVCSVGTVLINMNPLIRFDGYYMLADWLDEANLRSKADAVSHEFFKHLLWRTPRVPSSLTRSKKRFYLAFSLAGVVYRTLLSISIAGIVVAMFHNWYLPWIGRALAVAILFAWWSSPTMKMLSHFSSQGRWGRLRIGVVVASVAVLAMFIPIPSWRFAEGWVEPCQARGVYAKETARLTDCTEIDASTVDAGQPLFKFANADLSIDRIQRGFQLEVLEASIKHQQHANGVNVGRSRPVPDTTSMQALRDAAQSRIEALTIVAPTAGHLVAMRAKPIDGPGMQELSTETRKSDWRDPEHIGRTVPEGTLLAAICSDESRAVLELDRTQLEAVTTGTRVCLRFPHRDFATVETRVTAVVKLNRLNSMWQPDGESFSESSKDSTVRYVAIVELPEPIAYLPGASVDAVFSGPPKRLYAVIYSWLRANIDFLAD